MKTSAVIAQNNLLRQQLDKVNRRYYENLLIYFRCQTLFRAEPQGEGLLLEILQDIIEAQKHGQSASEYFGRQPKAMVDALIDEMPLQRKSIWQFCGLVLGIYSLISLSVQLLTTAHFLDFGFLFIETGLILGLCLLIFKSIAAATYYYQHRILKILLSYGVIGLCFAAFVGFTSLKTYLHWQTVLSWHW